MKIGRHIPSVIELQVLIWAAVLLLIFFSLLPMDGLLKSVIYTLVNTTSYAIIIYGNILLLYPALYQKGKFSWYGITVAVFLILTGILRGYASIILYQYFLLIKPAPITLF